MLLRRKGKSHLDSNHERTIGEESKLVIRQPEKEKTDRFSKILFSYSRIFYDRIIVQILSFIKLYVVFRLHVIQRKG